MTHWNHRRCRSEAGIFVEPALLGCCQVRTQRYFRAGFSLEPFSAAARWRRADVWFCFTFIQTSIKHCWMLCLVNLTFPLTEVAEYCRFFTRTELLPSPCLCLSYCSLALWWNKMNIAQFILSCCACLVLSVRKGSGELRAPVWIFGRLYTCRTQGMCIQEIHGQLSAIKICEPLL